MGFDDIQNRQELMDILVNSLDSIYNNAPEAFYKRVEAEIDYIEKNNQLAELTVIVELRNLASKNLMPMLMGGASSGSLVLYLLRISNFNPMPAHYFCKRCGYFEWAAGARFGFDLPSKKCPECGYEMPKDGFDVPIQSIWLKGEETLYFNFLTVPIFIDLAEKMLKDLLGWENVTRTEESLDGFQNEKVFGKRVSLSYVIRKDVDVSYTVSFIAAEEMEEIKWLSEATFELPQWMNIYDGSALGIINDKTLKILPFISTRFIDAFIKKHGPVSVELLSKLYSAENSFYNEGFTAKEYFIDRNGDIDKYIFDRDDVFEKLVKYGSGVETALKAACSMRKGKGRSSLDKVTINLPDWLYEMSDQIQYLFPRAHSISRIIVALQAAEYKHRFPYEYDSYDTNNHSYNRRR